MGEHDLRGVLGDRASDAVTGGGTPCTITEVSRDFAEEAGDEPT